MFQRFFLFVCLFVTLIIRCQDIGQLYVFEYEMGQIRGSWCDQISAAFRTGFVVRLYSNVRFQPPPFLYIFELFFSIPKFPILLSFVPLRGAACFLHGSLCSCLRFPANFRSIWSSIVTLPIILELTRFKQMITVHQHPEDHRTFQTLPLLRQ